MYYMRREPMSVEQLKPWKRIYTNTEAGVDVYDKVGSMEGTARKLAQLSDESVKWIILDDPFDDGSRQVQVSMEDREDEPPKDIIDQLDSWGYERSNDSGAARNWWK